MKNKKKNNTNWTQIICTLIIAIMVTIIALAGVKPNTKNLNLVLKNDGANFQVQLETSKDK